ncbi:MAG: peptidyl-prolyl cis-trans isomerase [Desulfobacteraceae bacterium]|nr:peptidyl-prolyl cis-trans isomerase [Desulfobacteraceae bacterium]
MLKYMRENTGSWIIKILLGLIVLVFVFLGMGSIGSKRGNQVATVNDEPITLDEYKRSYQNILEQMRQRFGDNLNDEILEMLQVKKQALDRLIEERLVLSEADRLKISISDQELRDSLLGIPVFRKNGAFDLATYKMVLTRNRMSPESFEQMQREALKQQKVRELVLSTISASDQEAGEWYTYGKTQMGIDYLTFVPADYEDVKPDDKAVAEYYDANKDNYKSEPKISVEYLEFAANDYRDRVAVSDGDIKAYYEENLNQYQVPEKVEARHILIKVPEEADEAAVEVARNEAEAVYVKARAGKDFSELAKKFSQGPSKASGGYLGSFARDTMVKPFADAAFAMEAGEIGKPVKTRFGWHVIKVEAKFPASTTPIESATADIRKKLESSEIKNLAYDDAGKAFDGIIDGDDLEQAGLVTGHKVLTAGPFTKTGPGSVVADSSRFAEAAFALPMKEIGEVREIGDAYYIIKAVDRIEPKVQALDAVRKTVVKDLTAKLRQERAKLEAETFLGALKESKDLKALAKEKGLEVKASSLFDRSGSAPEFGRNQEIARAAFELSAKDPIYSKVIQGNGRYHVIVFREKKLPGDAEIKEKLADVKKAVIQSKQRNTYEEWLQELKKRGTVIIEPGFLD